ncbi:B12-binding domain-containing radical SAM protein [Micromonospora sp. DT31]|uniref:B12-binding domain-containing radical SAM protein n=1 Tax=Micromonospora sp. DT31 TaxID=3393434 RepID=UPI003CF0CCF2
MVSPKVTIVFPPAADPSLPYAALPLLGAILRRGGYRDCSLRDVNLEAFDALLRPDVLREAARSAGASIQMGPATVDEVVADIDEARRALRDPVDFYDPAKLMHAKRIFHLAGEVLTAGHPQLTFGKYSYSAATYDSFEEVEQAVQLDAGPLAEYFRTVTVPSLLADKPDVIGFSVPYFSQLIVMFMLSEAIREQDPTVHITCGGPVVTWGKEVLTADPRFARWLDSFFVGEADETFLQFVEALDGKREITSVPNLVRYVDGEVVSQIDPRYQLNLDWSPAPDYTMMPMDRYFAPKRMICMVPTRGCYFNKCAFCNYAFIKITPYRMRSAKAIAADIRAVQEATGEDVFCFESDVILPRHLREIAEAILAEGLDIKWHAVARFEKGFSDELFALMRKAGCVRIYMGLESANDRVLKAMVKGTDSRRMTQILEMCHRAGIAVEVGVFSDFPSETVDEAMDTYRFVRDHRHVITRADVGTFRLLKGAPIADNPDLFQITVQDDPAKRWYHLDYVDSTPREYPDGASPIQRIQQLYPEVALIDVPEDILYTAAGAPGRFRDFFGAEIESAALTSVSDESVLAMSPDCEIQRLHITNSGAVRFDDGAFSMFEKSRMTITLALDRSRKAVYPLNEIEDRMLTLIGERKVTVEDVLAEVGRSVQPAADPDGPQPDPDGPLQDLGPQVLQRLVGRGLVEVV